MLRQKLDAWLFWKVLPLTVSVPKLMMPPP